jgi:hypothetical protein
MARSAGGSHMRNLTLASAKHLLSQGHINKAQHDKIASAVAIPAAPKLPTIPKMPNSFGSLSAKKMVAPFPQPGAQASLPGVGSGQPSLPGVSTPPDPYNQGGY